MKTITIPNLAGVATKDLVQQKGGSYPADYINWARVMNLLHEHAPGWQPRLAMPDDHSHVWKAPNGTGYLVLFFEQIDGELVTEGWPQAIMGNRNEAIPYEDIDARDITDSHRRGVCCAAAAFFGLGYELWAKMPLEDPYDLSRETKERLRTMETWEDAQHNYSVLIDLPREGGASKTIVRFLEKWMELAEDPKHLDEIANAVESYFANKQVTQRTRDAMLKRVSDAASQLETMEIPVE